MSVSDYFSTFCSNLRMSSDTVSNFVEKFFNVIENCDAISYYIKK